MADALWSERHFLTLTVDGDLNRKSLRNAIDKSLCEASEASLFFQVTRK